MNVRGSWKRSVGVLPKRVYLSPDADHVVLCRVMARRCPDLG
jgi:hypothetical protein